MIILVPWVNRNKEAKTKKKKKTKKKPQHPQPQFVVLKVWGLQGLANNMASLRRKLQELPRYTDCKPETLR